MELTDALLCNNTETKKYVLFTLIDGMVIILTIIITLLRDVNFGCLGVLRKANTLIRTHLELVSKEIQKNILYYLIVFLVFSMGDLKLEPHPDWSLLGVNSMIQKSIPHLF